MQRQYQELTRRLGAEFEILRNVPVEEIRRISGRLIAEGIERLRLGKVRWNPGFDGEYGKVQIFDEEERGEIAGQIDFLGTLGLTGETEKKESEKRRRNQPGTGCRTCSGKEEFREKAFI